MTRTPLGRRRAPVRERTVSFELDRRTRRWIEALFGDAPDGVLVCQAGRILYANGRMGELLGTGGDGESLEGRTALEMYPASDAEAILRHLEALLFSGRIQPPLRSGLQRRDGSVADVEVARIPLPVGPDSLVIEVVRPLAPAAARGPGGLAS